MREKKMNDGVVRIKRLKPRARSVGAVVSGEKDILHWRTVGREEYKVVSRQWAGLDVSGVQGTPLQAELGSELDSDSDDPASLPVNKDQDEVSQGLKQDEFKEPCEAKLDFSVDDEIIELLDSSDEEEYINSQQEMKMEEDRISPLLLRENDGLFEEETSDAEIHGEGSGEQKDSEEDDEFEEEEIQILNESQNSLYFKIKQTIKIEPSDDESQSSLFSKLEEEANIESSERDYFKDLAESIDGADEEMVITAVESLKEDGIRVPDNDQVFQKVIDQVEENMMKKLSLAHKMTKMQVKFILLEMKREDKDKLVKEKDLKEAILKTLSEDLVHETDHSSDRVSTAIHWMKLRDIDPSKQSVLSKLDEMKIVEEFIKVTVSKENLEEYLVRETVNEEIDRIGKFVKSDVENLLRRQIEALRKSKEGEGSKDKFLSAAVDEAKSSPDDVDIDDLLQEDVSEASSDSRDFHVEKPKPRPAVEKAGKKDIQAERRQRLKEIAGSSKQRTQSKSEKAPAVGVMKTSVPKSQKLLMELQEESGRAEDVKKKGPIPRAGERRERHRSDSGGARPRGKPERRNSVGFLEEEAKNDSLRSKKEKYGETSDGYKTVKKLSVHNVDYNIMSQDISKMPVPNARPLHFEGIKPKIPGKTKSRRVRWRDECGTSPLVEVREIAADNKGLKVRPGVVDQNFVRGGNKRKMENGPVRMDNVFQVFLSWNTRWLEEQKKTNTPPPLLSEGYQRLPLLFTFTNFESYVKIFLPLMFDELWSSVFRDYEEKSYDPTLVAPRGVHYDSGQQFKFIRCIALLSRKVDSI